ncbi:PREDICTED: serrate RNA effector molecule homolog isoform X1 [Polistes canadensis]|uniref:serrate RNA effector molecule homolog isoform X1 n=1 Tax=Polistes canadensis TaxID=91411 RepID=UPI000718E8EB|nr:PREDICTED: serrate RNA effector molecule homolog isoform X1 [Polistes canadensis]XP_014609080.1 PREDICTED: serrate RNA effector molecule homolog isoform X1 [Polistes canadensis]
MGDSDDEYDRKRRDKFRGERNESYSREGRRDDRRRDDWVDREWSSRPRQRPDYREYRGGGGGGSGGGGRDRYSPPRSQDMAPPIKRMRADWDDRPRYAHDYYGGGGSASGGGNAWGPDHYPPPHHGNHHYGNHSNSSSREVAGNFSNSNVETQPPMMSFKAFLGTQEDTITDEEAIKRYNEYKLEFRRQQLNEFFVAHKDEEWFKIKYHPEESLKRKEEQLAALKKRVEVFIDMLQTEEVDNVSVDAEQADALLRLLDAVVIKLEGGTEEDLQILDVKPSNIMIPKDTGIKEKIETKIKSATEQQQQQSEKNESIKNEESVTEEKSNKNGENADMTEMKDAEENENAVSEPEKMDEVSEETKIKEENSKSEETNDKLEETNTRKRKRTNSNSSSSSSTTSSSSESGSNKMNTLKADTTSTNEKIEETNDNDNDNDNENENDNNEDIAIKEEKEEAKLDQVDSTEVKKPTIEPETVIDLASEDKEKEPRALHKTSSIFLRNLAPTITKAEVEAMCKRFPGFLRVAIADPQPERRWFRRGWVSFERQVNIKEICWSLNNIRLRDCELGAIVNRDLSRRIRTVNGLTSHKQIVRHDIKLSAKIVHNLDNRVGLWKDEKKEENSNKQNDDNKENTTTSQSEVEQAAFGLSSKNPVLKNITDYLIEEASAEEEELLGMSGDQEEGQLGGDGDGPIERDPSLIKVLDRLILYLRVVHSVDYYNHCEYPNEDEMPNRCGIMHVRGSPPTAKITSTELQEYCRNFETKMSAFLQPAASLSTEEFDKLGAKNADAEVEKFVQANTQELAKDKWLCPLSGKKFKGPDFIRKHIFNKHAEKVNEVMTEAEYFNNYLKDPKRPQLPEHPGNKAPPREGPREGFNPYGCSTFGSYGAGYGGGRGGYGSNYGGGFGGGFGMPRPGRGGFNRGRDEEAISTSRTIINYSDLEQRNVDIFS